MEKILANILVYLMRLLSKLPLKVHYVLCRPISWMAQHVFHYRKDVVMTNLARSFPEKKYKELKDICDQFYRHLGDIIAEAIKFAGCTSVAKLRKQNFCKIVDDEEFNNAYIQSNGMVVLTSHCGNWELYGGWESYLPEGHMAYTQENVNVIYKKLSNKVMDLVFEKNRRAPYGDKFKGYLESRSVLRHAIEHKDEKQIYLFSTDQFPYKGAKRYEVPEFMHQKTYAMMGGAILAHKMGMGVAFMSFDSESRGHYIMSIKPICVNAADMAPEEIMTEYYKLLQEEVMAQPWNYLWTHKRWK